MTEFSQRLRPRSDADVRFCKSQNARLLEQNKKLIAQLERISRKLPTKTNSTASAKRDSSSDEDDFAQRISVADGDDRLATKSMKKSTSKSSIATNISELSDDDDLLRELEEEKKIRSMVEIQRDEALKSVQDLKVSLAKTRTKLKDKNCEFEEATISKAQEVINLRFENENLLLKLKESSTELEKLNAENHNLIEDQESEKRASESEIREAKESEHRDRRSREEVIERLRAELMARQKNAEILAGKWEEDRANVSRMEMETRLLRQELEHSKELEKSSTFSVESLKSCGLFHTTSDFRLELAATEMALRSHRNADNIGCDDDDDDDTRSRWKTFLSEVDTMKSQSRDGEKKLVKMVKAIETLASERDFLKAQLETMANENANLDEREKEKAGQLEKRETQLQQLLREVEDKGEELNDICIDNEKKRKTIEEWERKMIEKDEGRRSIEEEIDRLRAELNENRASFANSDEDTRRLRAEVEASRRVNGASNEEKNGLLENLRAKTAEMLELEKRLVAQDEDAADKICYYENLTKELKETKRETELNLNGAMEKADSINEERRRMLEEIESLKQTWEEKITKQRNDIRKLSKLTKQSKEREANLKSEIEKRDEDKLALTQSLASEKNSLKDYEECYSRLEKRLAEAEKVASRSKEEFGRNERQLRDRLEATSSELEKRKAESETWKAKIEATNVELESQRKATEEIRARGESQSRVSSRIEAEKKHLEKLVKDAKEVLASQSGTIADLEEKIIQIDAELKEQREKIRAKDDAVETRRVDAENVKDQLARAESQLGEVSEKLRHRTEEARRQSEEIENLTERQKEYRSNAENLERIVADQKREMWQRAAQMKQFDMALQEHRSDTDVTVHKLEKALNQSLLDLKEKVTQVDRLGEELKRKDQLCRETKDAAARAEANAFVFKDRVHELERKFEDDAKLIDDLRRDKTALELELKPCRDQLLQKQNQLVAANEQLAHLRDTVDLMEKRVDEGLKDQMACSEMKRENEALRQRVAEREGEAAREIGSLSSLVDSQADQFRREMTSSRESHASILAQRDDVIAALQRLVESNRAEIADLEERLGQARESVVEMKRELTARMAIVEEANAAVTLKDCHIAKLQTRLAALERLDKMMSLNPTTQFVDVNDNVTTSPDRDSNVAASHDRNINNSRRGDATSKFLDMASSVGVAPLRESPPLPRASPVPRASPPLSVRFDSIVDEKARTPSPSPNPKQRPSLSPTQSSPWQEQRLTSPPLPPSLQPTTSSLSFPFSKAAFSCSTPSSMNRPRTPSPSSSSMTSPPPHSAASELDVRFQGVIQYLKENGKCDDELEEVSREMKDTLKRSLIDKKSSFKTATATGTTMGTTTTTATTTAAMTAADQWWRQSLNSTAGSVEMEMESAEKQLKDLETQLRANALKRADIDSQLDSYLSKKKFF